MSTPFRWTDLFTFSIFRANPLLPVAEWLCFNCQNQIKWLEKELCPICSRQLDSLDSTFIRKHKEQTICYDCYRWKLWEEQMGMGMILEKNVSAVSYTPIVQEWMEQFKYRKDTRLAYFLASLIVNKALPRLDREEMDMILPIPLSAMRARERGFNQAERLADCLASALQLEVTSDILTMKDDLFKQSKKSRDERLAEMLKKFLKNQQSQVDIYKKRVLLLDDVYTTGATLYAAAFILRQEGAATVTSLTLAR
ncbi:ComF family protein [Bacillus horti]|uniref:Competence protein ComFC n=2 Tax=Caldalkalibacillus horti TaxID=77523 RepID=A0ABT9VZE8_9BACI|nr:competence protein ComFC [Bacillus horti]